MTDGPTNPMSGGRKSLFERVKDILIKPKDEWGVIDAEPNTIGGIYTGYVLILAAIGPIATIIGHQVFGISALGFTYKPPLNFTLGTAAFSYLLALVGVYVNALIIDALAPSFGGTKNQLNAFKVAAYSGTAAWLAGIFAIVPSLAMLSIVGLYSLYLLFVGLPRLMRVSEDKAIGYVIVVIIVWIVIYVLLGMLVVTLVASMFGGIGTITGPMIR